MESHTVPSADATVNVDALETVELLSRVEADPASDAFYSRLCEATCRVGDMDRAVSFRYDGLLRQIDVLGAYGIPLEATAGYLSTGGNEYRVLTIVVPAIVNDLWEQVA